MTWIEKTYTRKLVREVGLVVMHAAWVEDSAGELIVLSKMTDGSDRSVPAKDWAESGEQLLKALEKLDTVAGEELTGRLREALKRRNDVVHGIFLELVPGESWWTMRRNRSKTEPETYAVRSGSGLRDLIEEFEAIDKLLSDEISYKMGLRQPPDK